MHKFSYLFLKLKSMGLEDRNLKCLKTSYQINDKKIKVSFMKQKSYLIEYIFMGNLIQHFLKWLNPIPVSAGHHAYHKQNFVMLPIKNLKVLIGNSLVITFKHQNRFYTTHNHSLLTTSFFFLFKLWMLLKI